MFVNNECSIYQSRPQACRDFDCRVFSATGLPVDANKPAIARQALHWRFEFPEEQDHREFAATQHAALFLKEHADSFPEGFIPNNSIQKAVIAILVYEVFLNFQGNLGG